MTQQFHEGEEVEVWGANMYPWRKAKIIRRTLQYIGCSRREDSESYEVQFADGSLAVFEAAHIRPISPLDERFSRAPTTEAEHQTMLAGDSAEEYPGLADPDDDASDPMGSEGSP